MNEYYRGAVILILLTIVLAVAGVYMVVATPGP